MSQFIVDCVVVAIKGGIGVILIALFVSAVQLAVGKIKSLM